MKRIITITFLLLMALVPTWAQKKDKPRTVNDAHGTFTYTAGPSESIAQAKQKCEALAQLNAIEKEFGKAISSVTDASTTVEGENVSSTFQENTNADVRGEWIETTRATEFKVEVVNDQFVVTADVWEPSVKSQRQRRTSPIASTISTTSKPGSSSRPKTARPAASIWISRHPPQGIWWFICWTRPITRPIKCCPTVMTSAAVSP